jgi:hypothetical protein
MFGPDRFETRSKQVWDRAKVMEVGNGDVWLDDGIESSLMLIEGNSSRQTTLYRPEHPGGPPEDHVWPST